MSKITRVQVEPNYRLRVEFSDGVAGTVDLSTRLFGTVFEPLKDPALFAQVNIDEFGALAWPNGADLAPDALYQTLAEKDQRKPSKVATS
jgi:hypothetical protein